MNMIDLSHTICEDMPVFPGSAQPQLSPVRTICRDGYRETQLCLYGHTGTHMDAPAHILPDGGCLDTMPIHHFFGRGFVLDCRDLPAGSEISLKRLLAAGAPAVQADFLLFCTGWDQYWGTAECYGPYPVVSEELCRWAAGHKKALGVDTMGIDPIDSTELPRHRILLSRQTLIVENLCHLDRLIGRRFQFSALPLKYKNADGAPVRAAAIIID